LSSSSSRSSGSSGGAQSGSFWSVDGEGSYAAAASAREASSWSLGKWKYSRALSKLRFFRSGFGGGEGFGRDTNGDGGGVAGTGWRSGEKSKLWSCGKGRISRGRISSSTCWREKSWDMSISVGAADRQARYGLWVNGRSKGEVRAWAEQIGSSLSSAQTRTSDGRYGGKGL